MEILILLLVINTICILLVVIILKWFDANPLHERQFISNSKKNKERREALEYLFASFAINPNSIKELKERELYFDDYYNQSTLMRNYYEVNYFEKLKEFYELKYKKEIMKKKVRDYFEISEEFVILYINEMYEQNKTINLEKAKNTILKYHPERQYELETIIKKEKIKILF
jgi:hypothetical protein